MKKNVLIFGFYGYNNTGDEMILKGIVESLRRRDENLSITVLSADPKETERVLPVDAVYAGRKTEGLMAVWKAIQKTNLFILGGGGLLQDRERRILPFWFSRVGMAKALGKKVMFYGLGVGPISTRLGEKQIRFFANRADLITVRDPESAAILKECGVFRPPVHVTADPALSLLHLSAGTTGCGKIGFCLRTWNGWQEKARDLAVAIDGIVEATGRKIELVPLHGEEDRQMAIQVLHAVGHSEMVSQSEGGLSPLQIACRLGELELVVSMRLHGLILAGLQEVPYIGISYDPKVKQFMKLTDMDEWTSEFDSFQSEVLIQQVKAALGGLKETKEKLKKMIPPLQAEADRNADLAWILLKQ